jgi:predicted lipoprotein with Yx(FWY)xxD motif
MATRTGRLCTGTAARRVGGALAVGVLSAGTLGISTLASSGPASAKTSFSGKVLTITTERVQNIGTVLATSSGHTLYHFSRDPSGKSTCTGACAALWPPLLLPKGVSHIKAPHGLKGFSVIHRANGRLQVSFHHEALYLLANDKKGHAGGQGIANVWFAVLSNGKSSAPSSAASGTTNVGGATAPATTNPTTVSPGTGTGGTNSQAPTSTMPSGTMTTMPPVTRTTSPPPPPPTTTPPPPPTTTPPPAPTTTTTTSGGTGGVAF